MSSLRCDHPEILSPGCLLIMPRVEMAQRAKYENDETFRKLSRESEITYTGSREKNLEERQTNFRNGCLAGHADIAFTSTGINLTLQLYSEGQAERVPTKDFVDFEQEQGKVHLRSQFILNGVCVIFKGWMDLDRLDGVAFLEFDEERAEEEDKQSRERQEQLSRRVRELEDLQRQQHSELERRVEAEAEMRRKRSQEPSPSETSSSNSTD